MTTQARPLPMTVPAAATLSGLAVEVSNLVVQYGGHRAVDGLSFSVPQGSIYGFLGPNGAGKTSTIKALLGLRRPDGGSARVLGLDCVRDSTAVRARVGYVSEVGGLYDGLTVAQMLDFYRSTARRWDAARAGRFLSLFRLPNEKRVRQLSRGMKMQLAFALAVGGDPELLILDEPTAGLDPVARHELLSSLVAEVAASGITVFFSSHILSEVEAVADSVGIIRAGKLVVSGELDELKRSQKMVKLVYAEAPSPAELAALTALPGVVRLEQEGRGLRLAVRGDVEGLIRAVRAGPGALRDVDTVDMGLEDIFLEYMKEEYMKEEYMKEEYMKEEAK